VATSKMFSVLSRFTAFLAIDRSEVVNAGGELKQIVQPVDMPAGWDMEGGGGGGNRLVAGAKKMKAKLSEHSAVAGRATMKMPAPSPAPMQPIVAQGGFGAAGLGGPPANGPADAKVAKPMAINLPKPASPPRYEKGKLEITGDGIERERGIAPARSAYHGKLETLARELARATDTNAIRAIRQRLVEWIEDVRSVGGHDDLAAAVEKLVQ